MIQTIVISLTTDELEALIEKSVCKALSGISTPPPQAPQSEILDIRQAAELLHLAKASVYSYVNLRKIPYLKKSGKLLFSRSALLAWIQTGSHMTTDEIGKATNDSLAR